MVISLFDFMLTCNDKTLYIVDKSGSVSRDQFARGLNIGVLLKQKYPGIKMIAWCPPSTPNAEDFHWERNCRGKDVDMAVFDAESMAEVIIQESKDYDNVVVITDGALNWDKHIRMELQLIKEGKKVTYLPYTRDYGFYPTEVTVVSTPADEFTEKKN